MKSRQGVMQKLMLIPLSQAIRTQTSCYGKSMNICLQLLCSIMLSTLGLNWNCYWNKYTIQGFKTIFYVFNQTKGYYSTKNKNNKAFNMLTHTRPFQIVCFQLLKLCLELLYILLTISGLYLVPSQNPIVSVER